MPAEWEPHAATWLAWPHNVDTWPDDLERVRRTWGEMIRTLAGGETVNLLVNDASFETEVAARLRRGGVDTRRVVFHRIPTVDVWIRDYGRPSSPVRTRPRRWLSSTGGSTRGG